MTWDKEKFSFVRITCIKRVNFTNVTFQLGQLNCPLHAGVRIKPMSVEQGSTVYKPLAA